MAERRLTNREALAFLYREVGMRRLVLLGVLMLAASLTEGIGLLLLVPIAQFVAGDGAQDMPKWLASLHDQPLSMLLGAVVALVALRAAIVFVANEFRRGIGFTLCRQFRLMAHRAILGAEWRWLARQNSADHAALIIGEADRSASLMNDALVIATAAATLMVLLIASAVIAPWLTLAGFAAVCGLAALMALLRSRRAREGEAYWHAYARLQRILSQGLSHLRAARIAGAEAVLASEFEASTETLVELERTYFRAGHVTQMIFQILAVTALAAGVYVMIEVQAAPIFLWLPILVIAIRSVPLLSTIHQGLRGWRYNQPALSFLLGHIRSAEDHREAADGDGAEITLSRSIELRAVSLRYADRGASVFDRFDLVIPSGSVVGISGPSGSGKSSLGDLLAALLRPDEGEVVVDGQVLDEQTSLHWRRQVGYVEQKPFFLDATVEENLCWGRSGISRQAIEMAIAQASAEFILALPEGLATPMGEGGRQFSGGELQRLALARALLAKPQLLILDEVSAGLDPQNRAAIMRTIAGLKGSCTILLLSHDRELLTLADKLIDLEACG